MKKIKIRDPKKRSLSLKLDAVRLLQVTGCGADERGRPSGWPKTIEVGS